MASVALNDHFETLIRSLIEKGRFNNASEVVRAGLRLLEDAEAQREERLRALDAAIERGLQDIRAGRVVPLDEAMRQLRKRLAAHKKQSQ